MTTPAVLRELVAEAVRLRSEVTRLERAVYTALGDNLEGDYFAERSIPVPEHRIEPVTVVPITWPTWCWLHAVDLRDNRCPMPGCKVEVKP